MCLRTYAEIRYYILASSSLASHHTSILPTLQAHNIYNSAAYVQTDLPSNLYISPSPPISSTNHGARPSPGRILPSVAAVRPFKRRRGNCICIRRVQLEDEYYVRLGERSLAPSKGWPTIEGSSLVAGSNATPRDDLECGNNEIQVEANVSS